MVRSTLLALVAFLPATLSAQSSTLPPTSRDRVGGGAVEAWAGYSDRSSDLGFLGRIPRMHFGLAASRITRRIGTARDIAWEYTLDVIPIALISPPLTGEIETPYYAECDSPFPCSRVVMGTRFPEGSAYGYGFSPLGVTAIWRPARALQPRLGMTGGMLMFDRAVPTILSTQFNFTASVEAGVQALTRRGDGIVLLYRFHHLSNAGTGADNSAVASHVVSLGARVRTRR